MNTTFVIKTNWDYSPRKKEYQEMLEDEAIRRAYEMQQQGYSSGELHCEINGRDCRGWWELSKETTL